MLSPIPAEPAAVSPFSPLRIGPLTLRNRFIKSATNEGMARGGVPSQMLVKHHADIAAGGVGMTTVAYCAVSADGRTFEDQLQLEPRVIPSLRVLTDSIHRHGAAACAQVTHAGAFTFLTGPGTRRPLSASGGINAAGAVSGRLLRRAMSETDIGRIAGEFATAARIAREAGFDAVEIHMGHGYLLSQFLSPKYNRRRDRYGGDVRRRALFPALVLSQVLDAVGRDVAVTCKLCSTEGCRGGATASAGSGLPNMTHGDSMFIPPLRTSRCAPCASRICATCAASSAVAPPLKPSVEHSLQVTATSRPTASNTLRNTKEGKSVRPGRSPP